MSTTCLPSRRERIAARTRRVRDGWSQSERDHRHQMSSYKFLKLLGLLTQPNTAHDHWAAGAMTVADLQRLAS